MFGFLSNNISTCVSSKRALDWLRWYKERPNLQSISFLMDEIAVGIIWCIPLETSTIGNAGKTKWWSALENTLVNPLDVQALFSWIVTGCLPGATNAIGIGKNIISYGFS